MSTAVTERRDPTPQPATPPRKRRQGGYRPHGTEVRRRPDSDGLRREGLVSTRPPRRPPARAALPARRDPHRGPNHGGDP